LRKLFITVVIAILVYSLGLYIPTGHYVAGPGELEDLGELIRVEGEERVGSSNFYMVTITQHSANAWELLYGLAHPHYDLQPAVRVIPPGMSREEYNRLMRSWMEDSQHLAQVIALRHAGHEVDIVSEGVEVVDLLPGSPAEGMLQPGDVIEKIDGQPVTLAEEVVKSVQQKQVEEMVELSIRRNDVLHRYEIETVEHREEPGKAALLVYVRSKEWYPLLPVEVEIETGPVLGPSAGLMFVLEILDRVVPEDLAAGRKVAGTGTITMDEQIGGIGGVRQKVITAEKAGAEYFLVPRENHSEAQDAAHTIEVVPVGTLEEVLAFLEGLEAEAHSRVEPALRAAFSVCSPLFVANRP